MWNITSVVKLQRSDCREINSPICIRGVMELVNESLHSRDYRMVDSNAAVCLCFSISKILKKSSLFTFRRKRVL